MYICSRVKKLLNEAILKGYSFLKITRKDIKEGEIAELEECGYIVENNGKFVIIKE